MHGDGEKQLIEMLLKTRIIISCCFISLLAFFEEDCYASRPGSKECVKVSSASFTVRGRVIDTYGEPLIGATIREKGGANGTVTDVEGNFFLSVPDSAVLQISFVGYESQEVSVKGRSMLEICLKENILLLDHVIVTALGLEKKESSLAYAVQKDYFSNDKPTRFDTQGIDRKGKDTEYKTILVAMFYKLLKSFFKLLPKTNTSKSAKAYSTVSLNKTLLISRLVYLTNLSKDKRYTGVDEKNSKLCPNFIKDQIKSYKDYEILRANKFYK